MMMDDITFIPSPNPTIGVELEWFLVDPSSGEQIPHAPDLLQQWQLALHTGNLKGELFTSIIEMNSAIHRNSSECLDELCSIKQQLEGMQQTCNLLPSSTHPFSRWQEQQVSSNPRYHTLAKRLCWSLQRYNIVGIHVHIGMPDGETCIQASNRLLPILPMFLAMSANSPYWSNHDTGLASSRIKVAENLSQGGMPFYFQNWADFQRCAQQLMQTGSIDSIRDIWWEMRPHPDYGTLEIRIGDLPANEADTRAYAAYVRAEAIAATQVDFAGSRPIHHSLIRENRWRACRYGMRAEIIDPFTAQCLPWLDWLEMRLTQLQNYAPAEELAVVHARLDDWQQHGDGAERQRQLRHETSSARIQRMVKTWKT
jgi:carboxylate-amine ligase